MSIQFDFTKAIRPMRALHGVNNGPKSSSFMRDATDLFKRMGTPYSRLHDTEGTYGGGEYVDIHCVFPNFDADPTDPKNYNFFLTDEYIKSILAAGTKVIYRLGVSIENGPFKKYIYPPKDYKQWARICEGIVRHYTEGWADGIKDGVEYFEIWNEPEFINHMWIGTFEQFYELFKSSILYLKKKFPNVKFGGPATGYTSDEFTAGFFKYMTAGERAPLDFFSFHTYFSSTAQVERRFRMTREMLDKNGYKDAKIFCTEWNFVEDWGDMDTAYKIIRDHRGAAFAAYALCKMQDSPCDIANYYDTRSSTSFNGLYTTAKLKHHDDTHGMQPLPTFYSFESYNKLVKLGTEVETTVTEDDGIYAIAAKSEEDKGAIIARFDKMGEAEKVVELGAKGVELDKMTIYRLTEEGEWKLAYANGNLPKKIALGKYEVLYLTWDRAGQLMP